MVIRFRLKNFLKEIRKHMELRKKAAQLAFSFENINFRIMKDSDFYSLPKDELLFAAKASQKSAQSHFNVATLAASTGDYGIANSLLILSVEECIKAAILVGGYFNQTIPFSIEPFFRNHKRKHEEASEMQPFMNFIWQVKEVFSDILQNRKSAYGTVFKFALAQLFAAIGFELSKGKERDDFARWWDDADTQKKNGFYVGYYSGKWNFPTTTTRESYEVAVKMARPFVEAFAVVQSLREGDNILFSTDRVFSAKEINESEVKLIRDDQSASAGIDFDPSEYRQRKSE